MNLETAESHLIMLELILLIYAKCSFRSSTIFYSNVFSTAQVDPDGKSNKSIKEKLFDEV